MVVIHNFSYSKKKITQQNLTFLLKFYDCRVDIRDEVDFIIILYLLL
jgi:hypothetical protein